MNFISAPELPGFPTHTFDTFHKEHYYQKNHTGLHSKQAELLLQFRTVPGQTLQSVTADVSNLLEGIRRDHPAFNYSFEVPAKGTEEGWCQEPMACAADHALVVALAAGQELASGAQAIVAVIRKRWPWLKHLFADGAYDRTRLMDAAAYRDFVDHPGLSDFFSAATPVDELGWLNVGSRPMRRPGNGKTTWEGLRAIPWVFGWTQTRMLVPGWYGLGSGLRAARDAGLGPVLDEMRDWAFFTNLLGNVEMMLVKADLRIAESYVSALVEPSLQPLFDTIVEEHALTQCEVLRLTGGSTLLARHHLLR